MLNVQLICGTLLSLRHISTQNIIEVNQIPVSYKNLQSSLRHIFLKVTTLTLHAETDSSYTMQEEDQQVPRLNYDWLGSAELSPGSMALCITYTRTRVH